MARACKDRPSRVKPIVFDTDVVSFLFKGDRRARVFVPQLWNRQWEQWALLGELGRNHGSGAATWSGPPAGHAALHGGITPALLRFSPRQQPHLPSHRPNRERLVHRSACHDRVVGMFDETPLSPYTERVISFRP